MFTGIIQAVGAVRAIEARGGDARLQVATGPLALDGTQIGDSIAVNGVCLTVVELQPDGFRADVSGETLARTTLGAWQSGTPVNLEKALLPTTPLGGHLVSGHVDGVGRVLDRRAAARSVLFRIAAPEALAKYIAGKGSVCIDGVSLTVNAVQAAVFDLNIVPHTLQATTLDRLQPGQPVNIEVDLLARYLERLLLGGVRPDAGMPEAAGPAASITQAFLDEHGFTGKRGN